MAGDGSGGSTFSCHRCGTCCTNLQGRGRTEQVFEPVAGGLAYRLPTEGGLRVFAWEAGPFPDERLTPALVVADRASDRLLALAYELEADVCPLFDEAEKACTIYDERPLVCRAFPLLLEAGETGFEVGASSLCGARVPLGELDGEGSREARLAGGYPEAFAPALAAPAVVEELVRRLAFLATAGAVEPVQGLEGGDVGGFGSRPPCSIVDHLEGLDGVEAGGLEARAEEIVDEIRQRWASATP